VQVFEQADAFGEIGAGLVGKIETWKMWVLCDREIYHASGVMRELRNRMFQSGNEAARFIGTHWRYEGVDPQWPLQ
jgi:hypothetical protein